MHLIDWSTDAEDAKMLPDIPSLMNNIINDQLAFNLVDILLDNTLQILKSLLFFAHIMKIDNSKISKICPVRF